MVVASRIAAPVICCGFEFLHAFVDFLIHKLDELVRVVEVAVCDTEYVLFLAIERSGLVLVIAVVE